MISYIKGTVEDIEDNKLIIECNGIGYNIFTPYGLNPVLHDDIKIYTYLNVREDAMQLYGFASKRDLNLFKLLIGVNGIGPKGALGILSNISCDELQLAIMAEDSTAIAKAPGIGPKTAKKLIIELKDKLKSEDVFASEIADNISSKVNDNQSEAVEALVSLGYSPSDSLKAVKAAIQLAGKESTTEELLKLALRQME